VRRADNPITFMCWLSWNLGASTSWNPRRLSRPVMGYLYLYLYPESQGRKHSVHEILAHKKISSVWTGRRPNKWYLPLIFPFLVTSVLFLSSSVNKNGWQLFPPPRNCCPYSLRKHIHWAEIRQSVGGKSDTVCLFITKTQTRALSP